MADRPDLEDPTSMYGPTHRELQERFDTSALADTMETVNVHTAIDERDRAFIDSRDFFFLTTVDGDGWPTVSHKGGPTGVLHVEDDHTIVFPSYDGNGMHLSLGNLSADDRVGLLLIDFETPNRLRIQARASLDDAPARLSLFPGAQTVVVLRIEKLFQNCARYIHQHQRVDTSPYVPDDNGAAPMPSWKRIDLLQPVLPDADRVAIDGDVITGEEYTKRLADGSS